MRKAYFSIILLTLIGIRVQSQTQSEMNEQSFDSYKKVDTELNDVYKKILDKYKSDTLFIKNLKISQRIWISFRDAELNMKFPDYGPYWYGSMHPMCVAGYLEELTKDRIKTLKKWLEGRIQGDGCNGSIID
jgi:uncharacterized protein YecT (DUF1311 family)